MAGKSNTTPATYSPSPTTNKKKKTPIFSDVDWVRSDGRGFHQCRPACDLPVVISCASLALADAGIMLYDLIGAVSVSCLGKNLVIDPILEEEYYQDGSLMIACMPSRNEVTQLTITGEWSTSKVHEDPEDVFPNLVVTQFSQQSVVTALAFHPVGETFLCVGMSNGAIELWDVAWSKSLVYKGFSIWKQADVSKNLKERNELSVNKILFGKDGICGMAYSEGLVHMYNVQEIEGSHTFVDLLQIEQLGKINDFIFFVKKDNIYHLRHGMSKQEGKIIFS